MSARLCLLLASFCGSADLVRGQVDVPALLPQDALLHAELSPVILADRGGRLGVARLFDDPAMARFLAPLKEELTAQLRGLDGELREQLGFGLDDLQDLWNGCLTFSVLPFDPDSEGPDMVVTLDLAGAFATIHGGLDRLEPILARKLGGTFAYVKIAGRRVRVFQAGDGPLYHFLFHDGHLVMATRRATMERLMLGLAGTPLPSSLATSPVYVEARDKVRGEGTLLWCYCALDRTLDAMLSTSPDSVRDAMTLGGLASYRTLAYGVDLEGVGVRDRIYARLLDEQDATLSVKWNARQFALASFGLEVPGGFKSPHLLPADTGMFIAGRVRMGPSLDALMALFGRNAPRAAMGWESMTSQVGGRLGLDIRRELISQLGPEYAFYASWPRSAVIPDLGLCVQVRPEARPKLEEMIDDLRVGLPEGASWQQLQYRGRTIHYADLSRLGAVSEASQPGPHHVKLSLTMLDGFLVITSCPQAMKNLIHGLDMKEPRLADAADFKALRQRMPPKDRESNLIYADLSGALGFLLDNTVPVLQSLSPGLMDPLDPSLFPTTDTMTGPLFGFMSRGWWAEEGASVSEIYSPLGYAPVAMGLSASLATWLMLGVSRQEYPARSMTLVQPGAVVTASGLAVNERFLVNRVVADLALLEAQVAAFQAWEGRLPTQSEWPGFLTKGSPNHPSPYDSQVSHTDPWGNPYQMRLDGSGGFTLLSLGSDGKPGGEGLAADIIDR